MRLTDAITDKNGRLNSQKIWLHLGNIVVSGALIYMTLHDKLDPVMLIAYSAVVMGSRIAEKVIQGKYPEPQELIGGSQAKPISGVSGRAPDTYFSHVTGDYKHE